VPDQTRREALIWPVGLAIAFAVVLAVNAFFIYVAVSGSDDVVPSYYSEPR